MLQRVIAIKNVGRFKNCAAGGDVTFRRYTLIFAENARGKTTLCDILRSLATNTPDIIVGRATLGSTEPPEVQLLTPGGQLRFHNGAWSSPYPNIRVFDGTYVRENVFAGDVVDTEHRRNLYRVIRYLERINASFRISTPTHTYRGGTPSTSYQIIINGNSVDLGDPQTPPNRPSFKNTLSSGDRTTLALAFFFAQLELDADRANAAVVFDDPFGSMDGFRRNHTVNQIYRCGQNCSQVVVLSHDPSFLHLLWDRVTPADRKSLALARIGEENTIIVEWDIERAVQARYRADIDMLQRFFADGEGTPRNVVQKLRPVLEAYCRNLYPTQFSEQEMLGGIVTKIREGGAVHPLTPIVDDLDELNVYCRRYHHGENPNAATEQLDDAELKGYAGRTLKIVGCLT